jgi:hypothetical protein
MIQKQNIGFLPHIVILLLSVLFLGGCTGSVKNMQVVPASSVNTVPKKGKSTIVFLRPSSLGFAVQSSVFEIKNNTPHLVGIVAAKKKVAYELNPGKHTFMVISESGDFMRANLLPNKTYYALVTPRMGLWKARFSLKAIHENELQSPQFNEWLSGCEWVKKSPASLTWANSNSASIQSKFTENYGKWMSKDPSEKPQLLPQDGK